jgi:hypothetical protein
MSKPMTEAELGQLHDRLRHAVDPDIRQVADDLIDLARVGARAAEQPLTLALRGWLDWWQAGAERGATEASIVSRTRALLGENTPRRAPASRMSRWVSLTEQEFQSLPVAERPKQGRPCPWCDEIIEDSWPLHTMIDFTCPTCSQVTRFGPRPEHAKTQQTDDGRCSRLCGSCGHGVDWPAYLHHCKLIGDCPFCGREYMLQSKGDSDALDDS